VIGVLYMAQPDGCQHWFAVLPRLRRYPVSEHATCLHVCMSMRMLACAQATWATFKLTIALPVWYSVLFMFVFMSIAFPSEDMAMFCQDICLEWACWLFKPEQHESASSDLCLRFVMSVSLVCVPSRNSGQVIETFVKYKQPCTMHMCVTSAPRNCPCGQCMVCVQTCFGCICMWTSPAL